VAAGDDVSARGGAWTLWGVTAALTAATVVVYLLDVSVGAEDRDRVPLGALPALVATILGFSTVGALVAVRLPRHPIGWLFQFLGVVLATAFLASGYADYTLLADPGAWPAGEWAVWVLSWAYLLPLVSVPTLLFLLFPTGRPQSPRWAWAVRLTCAAALLAVVGNALRPGPIDYDPPVTNPAGVGGPAGDAFTLAANVGQVAALLLLVLAAGGLALRLRRSRGDERVQLKWFGYSATLVAVAFPVAAGGPSSGILADLLWLGALLAFLSVPLATGVAILRHRLYDIDLVIRRTLVYGALTATLVATYLALVLALQAVLPVQGDSDLAVAASTLAVAALFRPLRDRIRAVVDRRFYRSRYDAAVTLESFGARLRHQVDLEVLGGDLRGVVRDTMQPAHVSLWLRAPGVSR
jgi:hypothetical protein